ncbi:MAG: hypothetical protein WCE26_19500 [Candidatus Acidiferrales bacterium]
MRPAISADETTGSSRFQADDDINEDLSHDISYAEILEVIQEDYERRDDPKPRAAKLAEPTATVSWSTAEVLRNASNLAFAIEAHSRGMKLVAAKNILAGNVLQNRWPSGKKKHRRKSQKRGTK